MIKSLTLNVMAPLVVGNPSSPDSAESLASWAAFDKQLLEIKGIGADAVSTDIWWGIIEPDEGVFNWSYYDQLVEHITRAGLKWVPILSFHQCGGNIGDDATVMLPDWIWSKLAAMNGGDANAGRYVSEQGNVSGECISVWATNLLLDNYASVMKAFQQHFADRADKIAEINISLGPAGELRYPSYNSHDRGSDYPSRGALQSYSILARKSFGAYVLKKYGDRDALNKAWGNPLDRDGHKIEPPRDPEHFFEHSGHLNTQYGRDFFDWYSDSLIEHGTMILSAACRVFGSDEAPFKGIDIGAKVPGVHWRIGSWKGSSVELADRFAELAAGLIRSSLNDWNESGGWGYRPLISLFGRLKRLTANNRIVLHFTCLEMPDGGGSQGVNSMAYSLVRWVGREASAQGLIVKGENALNYHLFDKNAWDRIRSHLAFPGNGGFYEGVTFLRMSDVLQNDTARVELVRLMAQLAQVHAA